MIHEKWAVDKDYKVISSAILQENLASLRAKAGLSQEELANIIGVSRQTYYSIEAGNKDLSWSTYLSLIFFYHELDSTKEMLNELKIFPIELFLRFNSVTD